MIGSLTKCIAEFLRSTEVVKNNNIPVYTANTVEGRFTVNTSLPAILITVAPSEDPTVFISGNILDSINIHIRYMDDLLNYTMSEDDGIYEDRRDWAYQLRDELWNNKQSTYFKQFMNVNGLNIMYKGMSTYTQVGVLENLSKDIDVFSFIFSCNLFSNQLSSFPTVPLQEFFITLQGAHGERPDPGLVTVTASGEKFPVWNTIQGSDKIKSLSIHGKSYQNGTPTPANPVPMRSVGDMGLLLSVMPDKECSDYQLLNIKAAMKKAGHDGILRLVNGIYDEVVYDGKKWKLIQRIQNDRIITCTGVSNHQEVGFTDCYFYPTKAPINGSTSNGLLSTHFVQGNNGVGTINLNDNSPYLGIFRYPNTGEDLTKEEITAWLKENEVYVSYQLAEATEYPLDLPVITTYDEQTYFASNAADIKPRMVARCKVSKALDYIREGLIGYYTGRGRSNNDENKNILPDLSGNGNDLENKNFAYTINSGYGDGYIQYDGIDDYSRLPLEKVLEKGVETQMFVISSTQPTIESDNKWNGGMVVSNYYFAIKRSEIGRNEDYKQVYLNGTDVRTTGFNISGSEEINTVVISKIKDASFNQYFNISTILNAAIYCLKQRVHDVLLYDRILTEEEIKHNYKVSLQYNGMTL